MPGNALSGIIEDAPSGAAWESQSSKRSQGAPILPAILSLWFNGLPTTNIDI